MSHGFFDKDFVKIFSRVALFKIIKGQLLTVHKHENPERICHMYIQQFDVHVTV